MKKELLSIPKEERGALFDAMGAYRRQGDPIWIVNRYAGGLLRIRSKAKSAAGRCLFFATVKLRSGEETLVALTAYKKEGEAVPKNVLKRATTRMEEWKKQNGIS
jgi:hypothetical protein